MATKRDSTEGPLREGTTGHPMVVSVLIPGEDSNKYLLTKYGDRGWWLPYGKVHKFESIKAAAQRVATEVRGLRHCYKEKKRKDSKKLISGIFLYSVKN